MALPTFVNSKSALYVRKITIDDMDGVRVAGPLTLYEAQTKTSELNDKSVDGSVYVLAYL